MDRPTILPFFFLLLFSKVDVSVDLWMEVRYTTLDVSPQPLGPVTFSAVSAVRKCFWRWISTAGSILQRKWKRFGPLGGKQERKLRAGDISNASHLFIYCKPSICMY